MIKKEKQMSNNGTVVPETNKTSLGLYVTPQEAYAMWQADPEGVHFLDVFLECAHI